MEYVKFGKTGLDVSRLCLGCMSFGDPKSGGHAWTLDEDASRPLIRQAIEAGINFFDTANVYSDGNSEEILGNVLAAYARRDEVVIATKVFGPTHSGPNGSGLGRKAILQEIDNSLRRLKTDYVDLYQIHRFDYDVPIEETLEALNDVVRAGKARYIGASSMFAWQFSKMLHTSRANGWARFASMQDYVNLLYREEEREMIPLCRDEGIAIMPWSPLARGQLTRPWQTETHRSQNDSYAHLYTHSQDSDRQIIETVGEIAQARGVSRAQVALAWVLAKPGIAAPIIGAGKPVHLEDALAALALQLSEDEIARLEAPYVPRAVMGFS